MTSLDPFALAIFYGLAGLAAAVAVVDMGFAFLARFSGSGRGGDVDD